MASKNDRPTKGLLIVIWAAIILSHEDDKAVLAQSYSNAHYNRPSGCGWRGLFLFDCADGLVTLVVRLGLDSTPGLLISLSEKKNEKFLHKGNNKT